MYELKGKIKTLLFTISFSFANFIDLSNEIRCCLAPFPSFNSLYFQVYTVLSLLHAIFLYDTLIPVSTTHMSMEDQLSTYILEHEKIQTLQSNNPKKCREIVIM